jgi:predicted nucleic acid-binding Zn ribbon protein
MSGEFKIEDLLKETALLNYNAPQIQGLIERRGWRELSDQGRILAIYNYVRDEVAFGYNVSDNIKATDIINDGYGQCNTKGTLLMALLRAVGVPCRIHGFYVDKSVQKGAVTGFYYWQSPREILHSWVEIFHNDKWFNLEGFILDSEYLGKLQTKFKDCIGSFCGYGVAVGDFKNPPIDWNECDTYIQKDSIIKDLDIYDSPDELFSAHHQKFNRFKDFMFRNVVRHAMNRNINRIRNRHS